MTTLIITGVALVSALLLFDHALHIKISWINITFNPFKAIANGIKDMIKVFM